MKQKKKITIYTDGAYSSKRDQGGVGIVILLNDKKILEYSNMYKRTTNNQMELGAVIIALRLMKEPYDEIAIYSDSQYVIGGAVRGNQRKKNIKLWEEYDKQYARVSALCPNITFNYVRGHNGNHWNEYVDDLAQKSSSLYEKVEH